MKKLRLAILLVLSIGCHHFLCAQISSGSRPQTDSTPGFPSYITVLTEFYNHYSYSKDMAPNGVVFAKMKDGWHCRIVDLITEEVKSDAMFWDAEDKKFLHLTTFEAPDEILPEDHVTDALTSSNGLDFYSFDRCRYYGYNHWTEDMMADFGDGDKSRYSDTLLEGLARAYSGYASKFLWYQFGGQEASADSLKIKLQPLQLPSQQRIDTVNYYLGKAIETYKLLASRNIAYRTLIGNAAMHVFNEQMNGYTQMMMAGHPELAKNYIRAVEPNATIRAIAHNYLENCAPNTILFTFGDNDTYPLWYVQESENFRKDVAVINTSLLGLPVYIDRLRKNGVVSFSSSEKVYGDPGFIYFLKKEGAAKTASLPEFISTIQNKTFPYQSQFYGDMATYPHKAILFNADLNRFKKICSQPNLQPRIRINLPDYVTNDQLMVLDIVNSNFYNRPICFAGSYELFANYLQMDGLVYQLLPLDSTKKKLNEKISCLKTKDFLLRTFQPTPGNDFSSGLVADYGVDAQAFEMYFNVAQYYTQKNKKDSAMFFLHRLFKPYGNELPFTTNKNEIAAVLTDAGDDYHGTKLFMEYIETLLRLHKNPDASYGYISRKTVLNAAINIQLIFELQKLDRTRIDEIVSMMNKEDH